MSYIINIKPVSPEAKVHIKGSRIVLSEGIFTVDGPDVVVEDNEFVFYEEGSPSMVDQDK